MLGAAYWKVAEIQEVYDVMKACVAVYEHNTEFEHKPIFEEIESLSGKEGGFPVLGEGFRGLSGAAVFCYAHPQTPRGEFLFWQCPQPDAKQSRIILKNRSYNETVTGITKRDCDPVGVELYERINRQTRRRTGKIYH